MSATREGYVEVELDDSSRCSGCAGTCMWAWAGDGSSGRKSARIRCAVPLEAGEPVRVSMATDRLLAGTLLLHGLPLAALLFGGAAGALATQSDVGCFVGAVAGLSLMLVAAPRLAQRVERLTVERLTVERLGIERPVVERLRIERPAAERLDVERLSADVARPTAP